MDMNKKRCPICDEILFGIELNRSLCDACESHVNRRARVFREGQADNTDTKDDDLDELVVLRTERDTIAEGFL